MSDRKQANRLRAEIAGLNSQLQTRRIVLELIERSCDHHWNGRECANCGKPKEIFDSTDTTTDAHVLGVGQYTAHL